MDSTIPRLEGQQNKTDKWIFLGKNVISSLFCIYRLPVEVVGLTKMSEDVPVFAQYRVCTTP